MLVVATPAEGRDRAGGADAVDEDLALSLDALAGLLTGHHSLEGTLVRIAGLAVHGIPGAQAAGLTLLESDRPQTVVATDAFVQAVDDVQYGLVEGPCLTAVAESRTVVSGNLGGDARWPRFGPQAGRLGVHSLLSVPLLIDGRAIGGLNVYAKARDSFQPDAASIGEAFAAPAAVSVANAQAFAQAQRLIDQLSEALRSRAEIEQAIGIVMSRTGGTAGEAFTRLRVASQRRQVKLHLVASELVTEAVSRARARTGAGPEPDTI